MSLKLPYLEPTGGPLYWMNEQGPLKAAVQRYLKQEELRPGEFDLVRDYCVYWAKAPAWRVPDSDKYQEAVQNLEQATTLEALEKSIRWLLDFGIDPF